MSEGNIPEVNVTPDVEEAPKALNENVEDLKAQEVAEEVADKAEEAPQVVENANEGGEEAFRPRKAERFRLISEAFRWLSCRTCSTSFPRPTTG